MDTDWDVAGFVSAGERRKAVITELYGGAARTSELADLIETDQTNVSKTLRELRDRDLVELLVDEDRKKGRYYGITSRGEQVVEHIQDRQSAEGS